MKNFTVKQKLTAWLTLLILALSLLLLAFMLFISKSASSRTATTHLTRAVRDSVGQVSMHNGKLALPENFSFYSNGVTLLIYSRSEALLAGQLPVSLQGQVPFENGRIREIGTGENQYLALDVWLPSGWEEGVWIRGLMEEPDDRRTVETFLLVALISLPGFMALCAFGSYRIVRRAFGPLDRIRETAAAINEAKDLSKRIGLAPGKDEFSMLAVTFDKLLERLEQSFEVQKQFTADASHELRTPVSVIKGACEYSRKYDETPEESKETISMIYRQAVKMSNLISQLLSITRMDQGTEFAKLVPAELGQLVRAVLENYVAAEERLIMELEEGVTVWADAALLSRLIQNLVDNAFKYGKPEGRVWVSVRRKEQEAVLQVRDDGIGIPSEEQDKIWRRFYQVDPARTGGAGAGLGLSMVQQIAQMHKGYMTLDSVPGIGSAFTLYLPFRTFENQEGLQKEDSDKNV